MIMSSQLNVLCGICREILTKNSQSCKEAEEGHRVKRKGKQSTILTGVIAATTSSRGVY